MPDKQTESHAGTPRLFDVDAKAFFAFQVRAGSEADAKRKAAAFLESVMTACDATCEGYNSETPGAPIVPASISPALDGIDVDEACPD